VPERVTIDAVAIAEEIGGSRVVGERLNDLLGGPRRGRMFGDVEVEDPAAVVGEHDEDEEDAQTGVGTVKKSTANRSRTWLVRKVR
jgi:hypothetical protein